MTLDSVRSSASFDAPAGKKSCCVPLYLCPGSCVVTWGRKASSLRRRSNLVSEEIERNAVTRKAWMSGEKSPSLWRCPHQTTGKSEWKRKNRCLPIIETFLRDISKVLYHHLPVWWWRHSQKLCKIFLPLPPNASRIREINLTNKNRVQLHQCVSPSLLLPCKEESCHLCTNCIELTPSEAWMSGRRRK